MPLRPDEIIGEVVVGNGARFQMSTTLVRSVVDVFEPVRWFGPIADVIGRCDFDGEVVESEVFWAGLPSLSSILPIIADGVVVALGAEAILPGAVRIR